MIIRYFTLTGCVIILCAMCFIAGGSHMLLAVDKRFLAECGAGIESACVGRERFRLEWF